MGDESRWHFPEICSVGHFLFHEGARLIKLQVNSILVSAKERPVREPPAIVTDLADVLHSVEVADSMICPQRVFESFLKPFRVVHPRSSSCSV